MIVVGVATFGLPLVAGGSVIRATLEKGDDPRAARQHIAIVAGAITVYIAAGAGRAAGVGGLADDLLGLACGSAWLLLFLLPPMGPLDRKTNGRTMATHLAIATSVGLVIGGALLAAHAPAWWAWVTLVAALGTIVAYHVAVPEHKRTRSVRRVPIR